MTDTTDSYDAAYRAACRFQWETVKDVLASLRDALRENPAIDADGLDTALYETCGDHAAIIYTGRSWAYCFGSPNDGAYEEEIGGTPDNIETRALWALVADVRETNEWSDMFNAVESGTVAAYLGQGEG